MLSPRHAVASNFCASYTWFQQANSAYTVHNTPRMVCAHVPGSLTDFNVALPLVDTLTAPLAAALPDPAALDFLDILRPVHAFFEPLQQPYACWAPSSQQVPDAAMLGFAERYAYTGQYRTLNTFSFSDKAALTVERVNSPEALLAFADLIARGWAMPAKPYRDFFSAQADALFQADCPKELYLGLAGSTPACAMELFVQPEHALAGIYYVTTHEDFRRQGLAKTLQGRVLENARTRGYMAATVVSEPDERRLMCSLGFEDLEPWYEYVAF